MYPEGDGMVGKSTLMNDGVETTTIKKSHTSSTTKN